MTTERHVYWQGIIEKQAASGLTKAEFLKINNIKPTTYYYWFKKINTLEKPKCNRILPVVLTPQSPISSHQTVDIRLPNGYQLSFEASIEPTNLKQILTVLSA